MTNVAIVFPGQGSQYVNMLRELYEISPIVSETFREADEVIGAFSILTLVSGVPGYLASSRRP